MSVPERCISWPLSLVTKVSLVGSGISSVVTSTGPSGKILARRHRELLVVAHAAVNKAGVPGHILQRISFRNVTPGAANDEGKFTLEIKLVGDLGAHQGTAMTHQGVGEA